MKKWIILVFVLLCIPVLAAGENIFSISEATEGAAWSWEEVDPEIRSAGEYHDLEDYGIQIWLPQGWTIIEMDKTLLFLTEDKMDGFSLEPLIKMPSTFEKYMEAWSEGRKTYSLTINGIPAVVYPYTNGSEMTDLYLGSGKGICRFFLMYGFQYKDTSPQLIDAAIKSITLLP